MMTRRPSRTRIPVGHGPPGANIDSSEERADDDTDGDTTSRPLALLRTRGYLALLVLAAILGVPIAAVAFGFLKLVDVIQKAVFTQLPSGLGFDGEPLWWPLLPLALAGLLVALTIRYLPGKGGHSPADGFKPRGAVTPGPDPRRLPCRAGHPVAGRRARPEAP